ncbi:MAG: DUF1622 domain-containing protein [Clostridia bacterium]|nr:DUF1622 domain-containing protein [Clostridia bacterium]
MSFSNFLDAYGGVVHGIAEFVVFTLELVGILIIIVGSVKAIALVFRNFVQKKHANVVISLGKALALALEFKMGAEIINTVIVRDMAELGILAIVVAIRALLAILIHWEIKNENREEPDEE